MTVADRRRRQLDEALTRTAAALAAAGVDVRVQPSELGLARLVVAADDAGLTTPRDVVALASRLLALRLAAAHPGRTLEFRVPPWTAVQLGDGQGPVHTRGTPPSVVETDPMTFLRLATGDVAWSDAHVTISGIHADLSHVFPLG